MMKIFCKSSRTTRAKQASNFAHPKNQRKILRSVASFPSWILPSIFFWNFDITVSAAVASFCSSTSSSSLSSSSSSSSSSSPSSLYKVMPSQDVVVVDNDDDKDIRRAALRTAILPLSETSHKGSSGRVAVIGGSATYTGAPYYAAMAALKTGVDLAYVLTAQEAALPIKCYSPELMVMPVYSAADFDAAEQDFGAATRQQPQEPATTTTTKKKKNSTDPVDVDDVPSFMTCEKCRQLVENMVRKVTSQIGRVHCLIIGPGLGRSPLVFEAVSRIIQEAQAMDIHLVLDADALYMLSLPHYKPILQGYEKAVLTPNAMEYKLLFPNTGDPGTNPFLEVEEVTFVCKGRHDVIQLNGQTIYTCTEPGGLKRSGGIGDVLAGTLGALLSWKAILESRSQAQPQSPPDLQLSCWTACWFVKRATAKAFANKKRSMTALDVLNALGPAIDELIGH